jgi:hypothetical protein
VERRANASQTSHLLLTTILIFSTKFFFICLQIQTKDEGRNGDLFFPFLKGAMTFNIMTLSIMTLRIRTFNITTIIIMMFNILTLSITMIFVDSGLGLMSQLSQVC